MAVELQRDVRGRGINGDGSPESRQLSLFRVFDLARENRAQ